MHQKRSAVGSRQYLHLKEVEMLNKPDFLEDIKRRIITGCEIKAVEHKE